MSHAAFDALLAGLDPDRARAGERYELLRRKLVRFFEWRGAVDAEEQADETLNRVARRVEQGEPVRDVSSYALGVARLVWLEVAKRQGLAEKISDGVPAPTPEPEDERASDRLACLDACLEALPADQRELVLAYFAEEKGAKINNRKQMASALGIEAGALRLRVHRIRAKLETCVKACVARREAR